MAVARAYKNCCLRDSTYINVHVNMFKQFFRIRPCVRLSCFAFAGATCVPRNTGILLCNAILYNKTQ